MESNEPEDPEEEAEDFENYTEETHQFNYQQIVPTLRDIVYSFYDENPPNIPTPNIVNQRIEELRKSDQFREYRRENRRRSLTEMEQFYRDLAVRHLNLIQEWQRLNKPEGRLRLIEDLQTLENSIVGLINRYITNTERNIETLYATLPLNQHFIEYLMQTSFEIYLIRGQWEQTLANETDIPPVPTKPETQSKPKTTIITIAEESEETSDEVPSLLDICLSFSRKTSLRVPVPNEDMSNIDIWRLVEDLRSLLREIIEVTDYYYLGPILYPISPDIIRNLNENNIEINYELIEYLIQRCHEINRIINKWNHETILTNPHSEQLPLYTLNPSPERHPSVSLEPQEWEEDVDLLEKKTEGEEEIGKMLLYSQPFTRRLPQPVSSDQNQSSAQIPGNEIIFDERVEDLINFSPVDGFTILPTINQIVRDARVGRSPELPTPNSVLPNIFRATLDGNTILAQEWERLNTQVGRAQIIRELKLILNFIHQIIDSYRSMPFSLIEFFKIDPTWSSGQINELIRWRTAIVRIINLWTNDIVSHFNDYQRIQDSDQDFGRIIAEFLAANEPIGREEGVGQFGRESEIAFLESERFQRETRENVRTERPPTQPVVSIRKGTKRKKKRQAGTPLLRSKTFPLRSETQPLSQQIERTEQKSQEIDLPIPRLHTLEDIVRNYNLLNLMAQPLIFPSPENTGHEITNSAENIRRIVRSYETLSENITNILNRYAVGEQIVIEGTQLDIDLALYLAQTNEQIVILIIAWDQKLLTLISNN